MSKYVKRAILLTIATEMLGTMAPSCGLRQGGRTFPQIKESLSLIPRIKITLKDYGILPWQIKRQKSFIEKLKSCLPGALNPLCGRSGCQYIFPDEKSDVKGVQTNKLEITVEYERSVHFRDGFLTKVTFEMFDSTGMDKLLSYKYSWEPRTKAYYEPGMDRDEIFTVKVEKIAEKLCEELISEVQEGIKAR